MSNLVSQLTKEGSAYLEVTSIRPTKACRTQLIDAARAAGVRVSMRREGDRVIATVLNAEASEAQVKRDTVFRAVNRLRTGFDILTAGGIDPEPIEAELEDLLDIIKELEAYAREFGSQVTEAE